MRRRARACRGSGSSPSACDISKGTPNGMPFDRPTRRLRSLRRRQRRHIRGNRQDVGVGELGNGSLHQLRVDAIAIALLEKVQLADDVDRMETGDARYVAQAAEAVAVPDRAR